MNRREFLKNSGLTIIGMTFIGKMGQVLLKAPKDISEAKGFITFYDEFQKVQWSVNLRFLKVCPNYKEVSLKDLIEKYKIFSYFHNTEDYATIDYKDNIKTYFLNGVRINSKKEFIEKVKELKGA